MRLSDATAVTVRRVDNIAIGAAALSASGAGRNRPSRTPGAFAMKKSPLRSRRSRLSAGPTALRSRKDPWRTKVTALLSPKDAAEPRSFSGSRTLHADKSHDLCPLRRVLARGHKCPNRASSFAVGRRRPALLPAERHAARARLQNAPDRGFHEPYFQRFAGLSRRLGRRFGSNCDPDGFALDC